MKTLQSRRLSLGTVVWIVLGLIVASTHHFLEHLDTISRMLSVVLAVAVWPLVILHVHFGI